MKKKALVLLVIWSVIFSACSSSKTKEAIPAIVKSDFNNFIWELEYISEIRVSFERLYPEKKPFIRFNAAESQFSGNTSCNEYTGKYTKKENSIEFSNAIKTMIFCEGSGEETYLKMLGKVNKMTFDREDKLLLLIDDVPMMCFKKINKPQS